MRVRCVRARHLNTRAFGGFWDGDSEERQPTVDVMGFPLRRTWSLLASPLSAGDTTIELLHNATAMGWAVGDRLVIAPTTRMSQGYSDERFIVDIRNGSFVRLDAAVSQDFAAEYYTERAGSAVLKAAEVINLSRNIVITGDDFR